jgi:adenylyltransferase/sulfurtransferase
MVTIKLPTPLRRHAGQVKSVQVEAGTVGRALQALVEQYPAMRGSLYAEDGSIKPFVRVFIGTTDIADRQGTETPVREGETISIVPPVAGA